MCAIDTRIPINKRYAKIMLLNQCVRNRLSTMKIIEFLVRISWTSTYLYVESSLYLSQQCWSTWSISRITFIGGILSLATTALIVDQSVYSCPGDTILRQKNFCCQSCSCHRSCADVIMPYQGLE